MLVGATARRRFERGFRGARKERGREGDTYIGGYTPHTLWWGYLDLHSWTLAGVRNCWRAMCETPAGVNSAAQSGRWGNLSGEIWPEIVGWRVFIGGCWPRLTWRSVEYDIVGSRVTETGLDERWVVAWRGAGEYMLW